MKDKIDYLDIRTLTRRFFVFVFTGKCSCVSKIVRIYSVKLNKRSSFFGRLKFVKYLLFSKYVNMTQSGLKYSSYSIVERTSHGITRIHRTKYVHI